MHNAQVMHLLCFSNHIHTPLECRAQYMLWKVVRMHHLNVTRNMDSLFFFAQKNRARRSEVLRRIYCARHSSDAFVLLSRVCNRIT
jgi:hypothetical protein